MELPALDPEELAADVAKEPRMAPGGSLVGRSPVISGGISGGPDWSDCFLPLLSHLLSNRFIYLFCGGGGGVFLKVFHLASKGDQKDKHPF